MPIVKNRSQNIVVDLGTARAVANVPIPGMDQGAAIATLIFSLNPVTAVALLHFDQDPAGFPIFHGMALDFKNPETRQITITNTAQAGSTVSIMMWPYLEICTPSGVEGTAV